MSFRKTFFCALFVLTLLLFGKSLVVSTMGLAIKAYSYWAFGMSVDFASLSWKNEGFVLTETSVESSGSLSCKIPKIVISFADRHIHVASPRLLISQIPPWNTSSDPFAWTLKVEEGTLCLPQTEDVTFSCDYDFGSSVGSASFSKDSAAMSLYFLPGALDLECEQLPLSLLDSLWVGQIEGAIHLAKCGSGWAIRTGFLEMDRVGFHNWIEGVSGTVHWDGSLLWDGRGIDLASILDGGRLRVFVHPSDLRKRESGAMISDLEGSLSFDGKAGAKWHFVAMSGAQKVEGSGKGFFHSLKERWMESELSFGKTKIGLRGSEKQEDFVFSIEVEKLSPESIEQLQKCASTLGLWSSSWQMEKGSLNGSFQCILREEPEWNIETLFGEDLAISIGKALFSCQKLAVSEGSYQFEKAAWMQEGRLLGSNWEGRGKIERLESFSGEMSGKILGTEMMCNLEGRGPFVRGDLRMDGALKGKILISAEWQEEGLAFTGEEGDFSFFPSWSVERLKFQGRYDGSGLSCFDVRGALFSSYFKERLPFYCPILQTNGRFDIRLTQPLFDLARWTGSIDQGLCTLDEKKSHILGEKMGSAFCRFSPQGIEEASIAWQIPSKVVSSLSPIPLTEEPFIYSLSYETGGGLQMTLASQQSFAPFICAVKSQHSGWDSSFDCLSGHMTAYWEIGKEGARCVQGKGEWGEECSIEFTGNVSSFSDWDFDLFSLQINPYPHLPFSGEIEGKGRLSYHGAFESDFDVTALHLERGDWSLDHCGALHLLYSQAKGILVGGAHFLISHPSFKEGRIEGSLGSLQYDLAHKEVVVSSLQLSLPPLWNRPLPLQELSFPDCTVQAFGDLSFRTDFSKVTCSFREMIFGFEETLERIQNGHFAIDETLWTIDFEWEYQKQLLPLAFSFDLPTYQAPLPPFSGKAIVDHGLVIDWTYDQTLSLQAIEGECRGIVASFCLEGDSLIGHAYLNCHECKSLVPQKIGKVFDELKIGSGYELMGRLAWNEKGLVFQGTLSGKEMELFGFQLRNLLGEIAWDRDHFKLADLKVSDLAGTLELPQIIAEGIGEDPWKIYIPEITVTELRPSLLRNVGQPAGKLTPLVVRELKMYDFQGFVEDSHTYTAYGDLFFINSYKRGKSILELPSDLFSRILGLDLDLLVPVCGTLQFKVQDGFFHLTDLAKAYSENRRSEFFLVYDGDSPRMDFDWNLHVLIQMKQFVLFKFTEAFIISVTGKLDDPKFNLQRKNSGPAR